jgi:uncharacterized protein YxeA
MRILIEIGLFIIVMMGAIYVFKKLFRNDTQKPFIQVDINKGQEKSASEAEPINVAKKEEEEQHGQR